jgi:hypothetical protein
MAVRIPTIADDGGQVEFSEAIVSPVTPWIPFFEFEDTMWLYRHVWAEPMRGGENE